MFGVYESISGSMKIDVFCQVNIRELTILRVKKITYSYFRSLVYMKIVFGLSNPTIGSLSSTGC